MKIGDLIIYREQSLPDIGLIHDRVYTIRNVIDCNCKDSLHIDVGIKIDNIVYCPDCMSIVSVDDTYFFHHSGFRLVSPYMIEIMEEIFGTTT